MQLSFPFNCEVSFMKNVRKSFVGFSVEQYKQNTTVFICLVPCFPLVVRVYRQEILPQNDDLREVNG